MGIAIVLLLVAVGTVVFHIVSPWWWTPIASNWGYIDDTINLTFWITGVVFIAVVLFMAYCVYRFRHQEGRRAAYEPENTKLEVWLTAVTALGVVGMLTPGLFVWNQYVSVPEDAAEFEVLGKQWEWGFRFPGKDGKLGVSDISYITDDNPFGVKPDDPAGQDDVLVEADDLHLAVGKPIKFLLRSIDVLHDFYVPQFRAKMDMVPGMITYFWLEPTRTGSFEILCAELCGTGHHAMRGMVVVDTVADHEAWLAEQTTFAQSMKEAANRRAAAQKVVLNKESQQAE